MSEVGKTAAAMLGIAKSLTAIVSMYGRLSDEARFKFADKENPGGDPLVMLGPAANLEAWEHKFDTLESGSNESPKWHAKRGGMNYAADQQAELHPLLVLATWEDAIREELGTPTSEKATVENSAKYIRSAIPWMFDTNDDGDMNYIAADALAKDLRDCVSMLENLLKDGVREDHGVPCMKCGKPLLLVRHRYSIHTPAEKREDFPDSWKCSPCNETSTIDQYNQAVKADYLRNADRLTAGDMLKEYRIESGTLRVWANRGKVRKRGKDESGRILYDVQDALRWRDKASEDVA